MWFIKKILFALYVAVVPIVARAATDLSGVAAVNVTSDTAAAAKDMAFDEARRQIIADVLGQYAIPDQLDMALKNAKSDDLTNLIASSSIDGEQQSDTTYSANITMVVDRNAARMWMMDNNVQNWLTDGNSGDKFLVQVVMSDKLAGWIELNAIARNEGINLDTKYINGNRVTLEIPTSERGVFTAAIGAAGWRYADQNGVLHIIK